MTQIRLNKFLANSGLGARRKMDEEILDGNVSVNGQVIKQLGVMVDPEVDSIMFKNQIVKSNNTKTYIAINKPSGYLSTTEDNHGRKTVLDLLPYDLRKQKLSIVGRLDRESEGLMILTNDGEFANKMMHPKFLKEKEYVVYVRGIVDSDQLKQLRNGVSIIVDEDVYLTKPCIVKVSEIKNNNTILNIIIREGKKRQIREMVKAIGSKVIYLKRIRMGDVSIGDIGLGKYKFINI